MNDNYDVFDLDDEVEEFNEGGNTIKKVIIGIICLIIIIAIAITVIFIIKNKDKSNSLDTIDDIISEELNERLINDFGSQEAVDAILNTELTDDQVDTIDYAIANWADIPGPEDISENMYDDEGNIIGYVLKSGDVFILDNERMNQTPPTPEEFEAMLDALLAEGE